MCVPGPVALHGLPNMLYASFQSLWVNSSMPLSLMIFCGNIVHHRLGEVAQSCATLCDPVDCSPSSSSIHGILQARILEWVAIPFSKGPSQPRDRTQVSRIAGRRFNLCASPNNLLYILYINSPIMILC